MMREEFAMIPEYYARSEFHDCTKQGLWCQTGHHNTTGRFTAVNQTCSSRCAMDDNLLPGFGDGVGPFCLTKSTMRVSVGVCLRDLCSWFGCSSSSLISGLETTCGVGSDC
jgi:hypothetical protein